MRRDNSKPDHGKEGVGEAAAGSEDRPECEGGEVDRTVRFQLLNMVEATDGENGVEMHCSVRVLNDQGQMRGDIPWHLLLMASVDVVASIWHQTAGEPDYDANTSEEFVEEVAAILRRTLDELEVSNMH